MKVESPPLLTSSSALSTKHIIVHTNTMAGLVKEQQGDKLPPEGVLISQIYSLHYITLCGGVWRVVQRIKPNNSRAEPL